MSAADAYARTGRFAEHVGVVVDRAIDPITGLPVLVYRFSGSPVAHARSLDPDDVWRILDEGTDDAGTYLVTHVVSGAEPLTSRPASLDVYVAARAFEVIAGAARLGVVHGDLGVERIFRRVDDVWIEGYGVPWDALGSEAAAAGAGAAGAVALADDARRLARSMLELPGHALSEAAIDVLRRTVEDGDAAAASAALHDAGAHEPGAQERAPAAAGPVLADDPQRAAPGAADIRLPDASARATPRPPRNAAPEAFAHVRIESAPDLPPTPARGRDPVPVTLPASTAPPTATPARTSGARFSKTLPPDVTYRSGDEIRPGRTVGDRVEAAVGSVRDRRRVWLVGLLVVAALALALVTVWGQRAGDRASDPAPASGAASGSASYAVDVFVSPARLPPVSLVVVSSPPGSSHGAGTTIRSVPDRITLDRAGTWQLQGGFDGRRSEIVTLVVPGDTAITLSFTDAP
ncbi:hypothetical protein BH23DEI1_BH23DEI1_03950 [soil metagenome]